MGAPDVNPAAAAAAAVAAAAAHNDPAAGHADVSAHGDHATDDSPPTLQRWLSSPQMTPLN